MNTDEHGINSIDGLQLLLHGNQLPVILLGLVLHLVLRQLQLQTGGLLTYLGEFITVDDLSAGKDGLHGIDACQCTILHHRDADRIGKGGQRLGRERLGKRHSQLG